MATGYEERELKRDGWTMLLGISFEYVPGPLRPDAESIDDRDYELEIEPATILYIWADSTPEEMDQIEPPMEGPDRLTIELTETEKRDFEEYLADLAASAAEARADRGW